MHKCFRRLILKVRSDVLNVTAIFVNEHSMEVASMDKSMINVFCRFMCSLFCGPQLTFLSGSNNNRDARDLIECEHKNPFHEHD